MARLTATTESAEATRTLGEKIGRRLTGGEVLELISDLGGGKTTFVQGLAKGFGSSDPVASPTFTISYVYGRNDGKELHHFDFYRLTEAGIVADELAEVEGQPDVVTVVEWGDIIHDVLPAQRIRVRVRATSETLRTFTFEYPGSFAYLFDKV